MSRDESAAIQFDRRCSGCHKFKPEQEFHLHGQGRRCRRCKTCISSAKKLRYRETHLPALQVEAVGRPDMAFLARQLSIVVLNVLKVTDDQLKKKNRGSL
jgi:hypothetical protein